MKSLFNNINIKLIFTAIALISFIWPIEKGFSQGFNNNEWIFGYCGPSQENSYLSFGKGQDPIVRTLPGSVIVGENNNAIAIDPITGNVIFYSNGELVYDGKDDPMQGVGSGIKGNLFGRQQVAISTLEFDPEGEKLYYIFYLSPTGQLQYAAVDMNAPGQAVGNQPPLGEVTDKDVLITNGASGAIIVVKSSDSPSYLISYEGGNLISRRLEGTEGDFTITDSSPVDFTPKAILFDEERGKLILLPENDGDDIVILDYDTTNGSFGNSETVGQSGGTESIEGATFSPDGQFFYFSRGDELLRIPASDLNADPEVIPLENDIFKVYDIKVGPDGRLYYIYEEVDGGPQLIGRINNPNESDLGGMDIEEDPFNGTDFCGRIFPQFAPNQDFSPTVDFTWEPDPCGNNPLQLTSSITPANLNPVSFEWTFNPPLTDEDGEPVDIDFNQEHLLIPAEATVNQSLQVSLTVTFADGTTKIVPPKTIEFIENELEANFTPQDTTLCLSCIDLMPLLEVQKGGGAGSESPGGSGDSYEYFWSNKRDELWGPKAPNEVCLPGLYWVLVREPGAQCYVYAEIRVRIWDLPDQSNNIWYFGDGAGLDFNPDPDNPDGPLPRPVGHNQDIPAGTTTISDETGQVLFFTDGESVWDLNGNLMENGADIGGDNSASESVMAVPIPQNQTVFYVFTTQSSANGSNQVKYSVVDIKTENPIGVGSVVTRDNFLFSPSTEHSAALASGDTTWVLFHELGNNTFRAYPVSQFGIGQPVFSSVGSNHNFNTGVGSMKFSPDGSQLAITIQDGNCSRLEIFDFDQNTGRMTEYALLDLGCGDEIYGLEFSNDGSRIYVSFSGSPGKIEEFLIKNPERFGEEDEDIDLACGQCFANASTRAARENCILNSSIRNVLTTAGPFGALQVGPDGQIYVARPGATVMATINPGFNCLESFYTDQGVSLLPGSSQTLGLPAFVQQSGSSIPEPALAVPERLCLDPEFGAIGLLEGGGEPDIDSYFWTIVHEDGEVVYEDGGPGENFQNLEQSFPRPGNYTVTLRVDRCGDPDYYEESLQVEVVAAPELTLPDEFTLCVGSPVQLTAIDGYDPAEGLYDFEWRNAAGQLFGDENSNTIEVTEESVYTVTVRFRLPDGLSPEEFDVCPATKSVFVGPAFDFDLSQSAEEVCYDESLVVFTPTTPISGEWFYQLVGSADRVSLGEFFELELAPFTLPSPGEYEIFFVAEDPLVENCMVEKRAGLIVYPLPQAEIEILADADDCNIPNGSFEITALTDIQTLKIPELGQTFGPLLSGDVLPVFTNLEAGIYTIRMASDFGCEFVQTAVIQNLNPPQGIEGYQVNTSPEICGPDGIENGQILITFADGPINGTYQIVREGNGLEFTGTINNEEIVPVNVPAGLYSIVVTDDENDCPVPFANQVEVLEARQVDFTIPTDVIACGQFNFTPQSTAVLNYTIIDAGGNSILPEADGSFIIRNEGQYIVRGEDPNGIDCPREREFNVTFTDPPVFTLVGPRVDCDLGLFYEIVLGQNTAPEDVFIFWLDQSGGIISRNPQFFPTAIGTYFVEVQPRNGSLCDTDPIQFVVDDLSEKIDVSLEALPFCADDPFTIVTIIADLSDVPVREWYLIENGIRIPKSEYFGMDRVVIQVGQEGLYEVVLTNSSGCEIGSAQIEVIQSRIVPPVIEPLYVICAPEGESPFIDPGDYDYYSWLFNGVEIANTPTFSPVDEGEYTLIVGDDLGCSFEARFEVEVDCELKIIFPNAIILNDPNKNFVIYTNDFIDELEVFIYNRWGELIFYCESMNNSADTPLCIWDGTVGGKFVPIGTYPVVVKYGSSNQNVRKSITKPIIVLE
jgi:large repetitive protein